MQRITDLKLSPDDNIKLLAEAAKAADIPATEIKGFEIIKKSVDARNKNGIKLIYTVDISKDVISKPPVAFEKAQKKPAHPPIIIGSGPSGLFCALFLAEAGLCPVIIERGGRADIREQKVKQFSESGILDINCNIQFGEGGAGTFSDGKLTTQIKSPWRQTVLRLFAEAGAPEEILYLNKPHIGTDNLVKIVQEFRKRIISLGGVFLFDTLCDDIIISGGKAVGVRCGEKELTSDCVVLAIGHSARDTYEMLYKKGVFMEQKEFSCGLRIEHPQKLIDLSQYGKKYSGHPALGKADYKLVSHTPDGRAVYTFCMCPGGKVVPASSEEGCVVTNGMSLYARDGQNANSALLYNIKPDDLGSDNPLSGMLFQRNIESKAYNFGGGGYAAPVQLVGDFLKRADTKGFGEVLPSYTPSTAFARLDKFFDEKQYRAFAYALKDMSRYIEGFDMPSAVLTAVESRSSAPLRITRGEDLQSINTSGLFPIGEGCGYAGGIMSSAIDGIRTAKAIIENNNLYSNK